MKTIKTSALIILTALLFTAAVKAQDAALSASINSVINNYLALKNALVTANGNEAENKAKALLASINDVPKKSMDAQQLALWTKYGPKLEFDSRHISEVNLVPHQREHFASLSENLYAVVKALKVNKMVLYHEYCTMNKKYYISEATTGKDPYMGMAMSICSKTKDTLPAVK